mgnify:CR=1 FL=1|jgi:hypothetical protein
MSSPEQLTQERISLKDQWDVAIERYKTTYLDKHLGNDTGMNDKAKEHLTVIRAKIILLQSKLGGHIATKANFIELKDKKIKTIKTKYIGKKLGLTTELSNNKAGKPLKIDKYNENTKSYIFTSYYTIGILSMSYFIYKQLKQ